MKRPAFRKGWISDRIGLYKLYTGRLATEEDRIQAMRLYTLALDCSEDDAPEPGDLSSNIGAAPGPGPGLSGLGHGGCQTADPCARCGSQRVGDPRPFRNAVLASGFLQAIPTRTLSPSDCSQSDTEDRFPKAVSCRKFDVTYPDPSDSVISREKHYGNVRSELRLP